MGMTIFEQSGTFDPARYGLCIGSVLHVIVVGGGESGASGGYYETEYSDFFALIKYDSTPGGDSSFGTLVTAKGGSRDLITGMGLGGKISYCNKISTYYTAGGGGAGGYLPGVPIYGGNGGTGSSEYHETFTDVVTYYATSHLPSKLGGIGGILYPGVPPESGKLIDTLMYNKGNLLYANTDYASPGTYTKIMPINVTTRYTLEPNYPDRNKPKSVDYTDISNSYSAMCGSGGNGYGAGGGSGILQRYNDYCMYYSYGGNAGELKMSELVLSSTATIPVTVGLGGVAQGRNGETQAGPIQCKNSSGDTATRQIKNAYCTVGGDGAPGVVIVCW